MGKVLPTSSLYYSKVFKSITDLQSIILLYSDQLGL
jgi:hypothetical protein